MRWFLVVLAVALFSPLSAWAESNGLAGTGLQISGTGDLVGTFGDDKNRFDPREAEIMFYAPIDQLFNATLTMAAHNENNQLHFEVHELWLGSTTLIPRSRFRAGQFFLGFGRLNQIHRHDWPFISAPKVQSTFFDDEGVIDTGLEYSFLFPTPFFLDLTMGITNGWTFGHDDSGGAKPYLPTHYARLVTYNGLFSDGGMQTGLNYVGRKDNVGTQYAHLGVDLTAKWREAQTLRFLFQTEIWYRIKSPQLVDSEKALGFYLYPQYGLNQNWYAGLRLDGFSILNLKDAGGANVSNFDYGLVPTLSYKASEFSTVRAAYNFIGSLQRGAEINHQHLLELQAVFIIGTHPAHDF